MKIKNKLTLLLYVCGLTMSITFAQTQTFFPTQIPQTIIQQQMTTQCTNNNMLAFYQGSNVNFYGTLSANNINNVLRIFNTQTGQNNQFYINGAPDSSKIMIYNPYGSLSSGSTSGGPNSFISNFGYVSNIKPAGIQTVYVSYQNSPTYMLGDKERRNQLVGQIIHNIRRRAPYSVNAGGIEYTYLPLNASTQSKINLTLQRSTNNGYNRTDNNEYRCNSIYIATCGDKIIDDPNKAGSVNTDGKQGIQTNNGFIPWAISTFTPEVCDSNTETGAACTNGTLGCCNETCSGFGGGFCGDGIVQEELDEQCDLGPWDEDTGQGNNDSYQFSECATYCEFNLEPETLPEELG